ALIREGQYNKAIKKLNKVIEKNPKFFGGYLYLGDAYYEMRDYHSSIEMYKKTVELKPNCVDAYTSLGISCFSGECFNESLEAFRMAKEIEPHSATAYHNMGAVYYAMGKFQDSLRAYTKAAHLRPRDTDTRNGLISACVALGEPEKAITLWEKITHDSPNFSFYLVLGIKATKKGQLSEADKYLKRSLKLNSSYPLIYGALGRLYFKQGRLKEGLDIYQKCKAKNGDYAVEIFKACREVVHSNKEIATMLREQIDDLEGELKELAQKFLTDRKQ
ncbi:MAG: tetratricopeptide repeat protein, partial [Candidatus Brocadiales bacterium]